MFTKALAFAALALQAVAQDSSTSASASTTSGSSATGRVSTTAMPSEQTSITGLLGVMTTGFAGSVIAADNCETTLEMACTNTRMAICSSYSDVKVTVTQGPSTYRVAYETSTAGTVASIQNECQISGPAGAFTNAVCTEVLSGSVYGTEVSTTTSYTLTTETDYFQYGQIPITAGAEKLPSGNPTCTASPGAAAAMATGSVNVYKVLVPIGAALAAGAMM